MSAASKTGRQPLHDANAPIARYLISEGADVNAQDHTGQAPLHRAARFAREAVIHLLLQNGAELAITDRMGRTALDEAIRVNEEPTARQLRSYGAVRGKDLATLNGR